MNLFCKKSHSSYIMNVSITLSRIFLVLTSWPYQSLDTYVLKYNTSLTAFINISNTGHTLKPDKNTEWFVKDYSFLWKVELRNLPSTNLNLLCHRLRVSLVFSIKWFISHTFIIIFKLEINTRFQNKKLVWNYQKFIEYANCFFRAWRKVIGKDP